MNPVSLRYELKLRRQGAEHIAGVDEVGIGPLAGPVVAACVILDKKLSGLDDSKKLTEKQRVEMFRLIIGSSHVGVGIIDNTFIDLTNILKASLRAMAVAINSLSVRPDHILVDGIRKVPGISIPQTPVKHGDAISSSLAAASIVAKVIRDALMDDYNVLYPHYGFSEHKGYGTELHMKMIKKHGTCPIHRISFQPVHDSLVRKGILFFKPLI